MMKHESNLKCTAMRSNPTNQYISGERPFKGLARWLMAMSVIGCLPSNVNAAIFGNFTYTEYVNAIYITGYPKDAVGPVVIPSTIINKPVTHIGSSAFSQCNGLTSITIPDSVIQIETSAFYECSGLTSLTIGNGVFTIGNYAFYGCGNLTNVAIPSSVVTIGSNAFENCSGLTNITIPVSANSIGNYAFSNCTGLTSITISGSVTGGIADYAFAGCTVLKSVFFNGDAPPMGWSVFLNDDQAVVYYLPGTVGWSPVFGTRPTMLWSAPVIANQPDSAAANLGESVAFEVIMSPLVTLPASFQWFRNGVAIPGANSPSLELDGIQSSNAGIYKVVITNDAGSVESATASLTIPAGNLYTQAQYDASLTSGYNLGVSAVTSNPNIYGLYTLSQVQTIHVGTPLLAKDPSTGKFKLTINAKKSTDLTNYSDLNFATGESSINPAGDFEFLFSSGDNAAFFRLETR